MDYKEKINNFLKGIGFIEKDGKFVNSSGICDVESSFDELGNWNLRAIVTMSNIVDGTMLKKLHENGELNEMFLIKVFSNSMKHHENTLL